MAHTEIFILNYNGAHFLKECLSSLCAVELGANSMHVSVVDNCSHDNSAEVVRQFKDVSFIKLDKNYGFSKGNNLGVWKRLEELTIKGNTADLVCFLNNDTIVEPTWLTAATERFASDTKIGVVGSKANFYDRFIEVQFKCSPVFRPRDTGSLDSRDLGVFVRAPRPAHNIQPNPRRSKWVDAYPADPCGGRWLKPEGRILIAVQNHNKATNLDLVFENRNPTAASTNITLTIGGHEHTLLIPEGETRELSVTVPANSAELFIQNAGSFVTNSWEAGDDGTFRRDSDSFEEPREVAAICGVSMFMRTELFQKLKGFDEAFFAYFEDTDLSLRARLEGYTCWYEPRSRLRHIHCGSGGEFSPYFNFNVTHSHLLFTGRWMAGQAFLKKFVQVCRWAWLELKAFESDVNIETKPNLRTVIRMLKHPLRIPSRRLFNLNHLQSIRALKRDEMRSSTRTHTS
jgi:GT2 family glycosyltransferase